MYLLSSLLQLAVESKEEEKKSSIGSSVDLVGNAPDKVDNALSTGVTNIINNVIAVLGLACVIVMIIGGVQYMTSNGEADKVKKGKNTILYGLIGLIICVLAFAIVNFVIKNILSQQ